MALPAARLHVHGVGGHAVRAGARARFAARRAGRASLSAAKVVLWLAVVMSSLLAIGLFASRGSTYRDPDVDRVQREHQARARLELHQRAIVIDHVVRYAR